MQWARDVVVEHRAASIRSVASLLTATMRVMVAGMDADPTVVQTTLDVVETAIGTLRVSDGDAAIATVTTTIAPGAVAGRGSQRIGSVP